MKRAARRGPSAAAAAPAADGADVPPKEVSPKDSPKDGRSPLIPEDIVSRAILWLLSAACRAVGSSLHALVVQMLHLAYAIAILLLMHPLVAALPLQLNDSSSRVVHLIWLATAACLVVDNARRAIGLLGMDPAKCAPLDWLLYLAAQLSFLSHESLTPLALLFIPHVLFQHPTHASALTQRVTWVAFSLVSALLAVAGLRRYAMLKNWTISVKSGTPMYSPSVHSTAALIPIFLTVGGLILASTWLLWLSHANTKTQALLFGQAVVLVGNGAIGPYRELMNMFGNLFEVIWLWSIAQTL